MGIVVACCQLASAIVSSRAYNSGEKVVGGKLMSWNHRFYRTVRFWSGLVVIGLMLPNVLSVSFTSVFWWVSLACLVGGVGYTLAGFVKRS